MKFKMLNFLPLFLSVSALAGLGEGVGSIEKDRQSFSGTHRFVQTKGSHTLHEIVNRDLKVREYISKDGVIFAISWRGNHHPDLEKLLGKYFQDYQQTLQTTRRVRGRLAHSQIKGADVIVTKFGHMRALQGKAYVPALMPQGMDPNEIK